MQVCIRVWVPRSSESKTLIHRPYFRTESQTQAWNAVPQIGWSCHTNATSSPHTSWLGLQCTPLASKRGSQPTKMARFHRSFGPWTPPLLVWSYPTKILRCVVFCFGLGCVYEPSLANHHWRLQKEHKSCTLTKKESSKRSHDLAL